MQFHIVPASYDAQLQMKGRKVKCFSPQSLKKLYPDGDFTVVGEIGEKKAKKSIGMVRIDHDLYDVVPPNSKSRLLWRTAGYLQVGKGEYVAVLKNRLYFLLVFLLMLAIVALLLSTLLTGRFPPWREPEEPPGPIVIDPDHPLPPPDENAKPLEGDDSEKADVGDGGGSLTLVFTLKAEVNLATGDIAITYENPNSSTHNIMLDLYIISGGQEYLIARSGLVEPGYSLTALQLAEDAPVISEGIYAGLFRIHSFDPLTGEQASVVPEVPDVEITVKNG